MAWNNLIGIAAGGFAGILYNKKVGCPSGTCPITSNLYLTILYGAAIGYLISSYF
nr:DUF6132 family protein [uncultured Clostridium sp.]